MHNNFYWYMLLFKLDKN